MKVNRQKLVSILSAIKPGLAKKQIVEEAAHFIFTGEVPDYSNNYYIIYGIAGVLIYLLLFTKRTSFRKIKNQFDKSSKRRYNKRHNKK